MNTPKPHAYKVPLGVHDGRIGEPAAWELLEYVYRPRIERHKPMFGAIVQYNKAHTVMMAEQGILSREDAVALLGALQEVGRAGVDAFALDYEAQDISPNIEAILIDKLGEPIGGKILTGRSRADAQYTPDRLTLRNWTLKALEELLKVIGVLLRRAAEHLETVMPTYTFIQSAQPGTFAHYLMSYVEALATDFDRLEASYRRLCLSPAEIGIAVGTTHPVSRERVAELLGFEGLLENTRRALSSTDIELETMSNFAIALTHLSRVADDFSIWSSQEFGMVELADRYCNASFLMPQKKNPNGLNLPRLTAITVQGNLMSAFNLFRLTPVAYPQDVVLVSILACETVELVTRAFKMMQGVLDSVTVHASRMRQLSAAYFTQATDIADALVREHGFSFRAAHRTVGAAVRQALADNQRPESFNVALLDAAAREVVGRATGLSQERLNQFLDVDEAVRLRKATGGPAPERVAQAIERHRALLSEMEARLERHRQHLSTADAQLEQAVAAYVSGAPMQPERV